MDELDKALAIAISGPERDRALDAFMGQLALWQITLPPAMPLVLDFGLRKFKQTGLIESWIANETGPGYCGKYLFVFSGQTCPRHSHQTKHETFFVMRGRIMVYCQGTERILEHPAKSSPLSPARSMDSPGSSLRCCSICPRRV